MLDSIKELFAVAPILAWSMAAVTAVVFIASIWKWVKWPWMNAWMNFPVIGKIARYSRDTYRARGYEGWFRSELVLCLDYKRFLRDISEQDYKEKVEYLALAGDSGRSQMPGWMWPFMILVVFVQAVGVSELLTGFTIPFLNETLRQNNVYGIALLISGLLVFLGFSAGHELYRNGRIIDARREWQQSGRKSELRSGTVTLSKPQNIDADYPEYTRRLNRIGTTAASYKVSIGAIIFVALVAIGAIYAHAQTLQKMQVASVSQTQKIEKPFTVAAGLNISAEMSLPASDVSDDVNSGWSAFIEMAFMFAGLQFLSVYFGFRWGFAGQNSAQAFRAIGAGKFASYEQLLNHNHYISETAQITLEELQQRIMQRLAKNGDNKISSGNHTFDDFMQAQRERQIRNRERQRAQTRLEAIALADKAALASASGSIAETLDKDSNAMSKMEAEPQLASEVIEEAKPIAEAKAKDDIAAPKMKQPPRVLEMALHQVSSLKSLDNKMAFIKTLPEALQSEVLAALNLTQESQQSTEKSPEV